MTGVEVVPEFIRGKTINTPVEEIYKLIQAAEASEKATGEDSFDDIPGDFVHASFPASSTLIDLDQGDE